MICRDNDQYHVTHDVFFSAVNPVIVIGAGGHAKVLINMLTLLGREIIGITDPELTVGSKYEGQEVIGDDKVIQTFRNDSIELVNGIGSIPGNDIRWTIDEKYKALMYTFSTVIHPSAILAENVEIGEGVQIMAGVVIQPGVAIGRSSIINTGVIIDHDCHIDDHCHLAPGVAMSGAVKIGKDVHLGTASNVIHGINIGHKCVIAAGATVFRDLPDNSIYYGKDSIHKKFS